MAAHVWIEHITDCGDHSKLVIISNSDSNGERQKAL